MRYRKRPIVIEAFCFPGHFDQDGWPGWLKQAWQQGLDNAHRVGSLTLRNPYGYALVTLEGVMNVPIGDYVIQGIAGELYCCEHSIFNRTYEEVLDEL